jgi:ADP-ribosylglycohydrolase
MAFRDASISHIKNGIYGEMFVAAMIARAAVSRDIVDIIRAGLSQIPAKCRLSEAVERILALHEGGMSEEEVFADIHGRWNEYDNHDWCHTISNAEIVVACLLWCEGDYGRSVCRAVQTGFDTDCNGATVGSILGMRGGMAAIDPCWTEPFHGMLDTQILDVGRVSIESCVKKTVEHMKAGRT